VLSSGMMGGLTSPARPWFALRTADPVLNEAKPVRVWLDTVRQRMTDVFLRSNLYQALPVAYEDLGVFSTTAFEVVEDEQTTIRCYPAPIGSYWLGISARGVIDTFVREFQMTYRQLVDRFGEENCSERVKAGAKEQKDTWVDVIHFVEPNPDHDPEKPWAKDKAFRSIYYEKTETEKALSESGFDEFPVMVARWGVCGEDIYGTRCPGMQALGDIKTLMLGEKRKWEAVDKLVRPPMTGPSSLKNATASMLPGGMTYVDVSQGQQGFQPAYQINPHLGEFDAMLRQLESRIDRAFFADLFLMIAQMERSGVTATEINERREEKMLMLGPVLERLNDELFDPLIKRVFNIMLRQSEPIWAGLVAGTPLLPPPPPEMEGLTLTIDYVSVLAQAQKLIGVSALEKLTVYIGNLMTAFPEAADRFDADQAIEEYGGMVGAGPKIIRDAKEVAAIRAARAKRDQAQESMMALQQGAQTAQTLGQTPITDDTALGAMLSRMGGGTPA
jgi:hypothetical protein